LEHVRALSRRSPIAKLAKKAPGNGLCVTFLVRDLNRAIEFYVGKQGFAVEREKPHDYVMIDVRAASLCLDLEDEVDRAWGGGA